MKTITARQRVLAFLQRRKVATAAQIGVALGMSAATVRHHLAVLAADGRVVGEGVQTGPARGRPQKRYRLSDRLRGDDFALLSESLLDTWLQGMPEPERDAALRAVAERISTRIGGPGVGMPAPKRLEQLTQKLTELHYDAGWEAGSQGPHIVLGNCPYAAIISRHPELCRMDALILGRQMNADAVQLSKMETGAVGGPTHCVFAVRQLGPSAD